MYSVNALSNRLLQMENVIRIENEKSCCPRVDIRIKGKRVSKSIRGYENQ
jgi:hypothetical protein